MKESSRKHSKSRREEHKDKYRNVLKERPYRDTSDAERRHRQRKDEESRHKKSRSKKEESYEELSRKKRKIESELHALDLEEEAERRRKEEDKKSTERSRKKSAPLRIKEEPVSDVDTTTSKRNRPKRTDNGRPDDSSDDNRERRPHQESKPSKDGAKPKEKPDFTVSGKLAEDTNMYNGVVIKYNEPTEARKPRRRWRLYPFKGDSEMPFIPVHRQSAYLFGRTRSIADIPIDHPSCSKQHAVLQFRLVPYQRDDGTKGRRVRPYIIDLESSNGTFVNNRRIDARCYVELMEKDVVKFGFSTREYVVLHEESKNEDEDDDILDSN